jgi:phosphoglucomutase
MMERFRKTPPTKLGGVSVASLFDYDSSEAKDMNTGQVCTIDLPKSNVLQFVLEDGSKISARPSGTEPKIKFYFSVQSSLTSELEFESSYQKLGDKIEDIIKDLAL